MALDQLEMFAVEVHAVRLAVSEIALACLELEHLIAVSRRNVQDDPMAPILEQILTALVEAQHTIVVRMSKVATIPKPLTQKSEANIVDSQYLARFRENLKKRGFQTIETAPNKKMGDSNPN